jgi:hypothetical protein
MGELFVGLGQKQKIPGKRLVKPALGNQQSQDLSSKV